MPPPSIQVQKDTTPIVINNEDVTATPAMTTMESTENMPSESVTDHPKDITTTTVKASTTLRLTTLLVFVITLRMF
ncbi:unnamed protein product [Haemonchus placei]|uniref:Uncharacterized protein n=1 Tax=Haemonchus placei TaxID=6290 RepID=A0A0N4W094_HAEPC|nr:unnamed protein product [Haemonchus placei]VDO92808.1 unnamed protein product [Haemonchus placei]